MKLRIVWLPFALIGLSLASAIALQKAAADDYVFEDLGVCVRHSPSFRVRHILQDAAGRDIAWGLFSGFYLDTGEHVGPTLDELIDQFGVSKLRCVALGPDGNAYAYYGKPSHFLRYDPRTGQLADLGVPDDRAFYYLGDSAELSPDGVFYVGTYPGATLVSCDTATGKIKNEGRLTDDKRQSYILSVAAADDGIVYCGVGLHHAEVAAYNPKTGAWRQILTDRELQLPGKTASLWRAADGKVYGKIGDACFHCTAGAIEIMRDSPPPASHPAPRSKLANGHKATVRFDGKDSFAVHDENADEVRNVKVKLEGAESDVYCLGCEWGERIIGGANHPANVFYYDTANQTMGDLGLSLGVQTYAVIAAEKGVFFTTYTGGRIHFYDPNKPVAKNKNPVELTLLSETHLQERLTRMVEGPDGNIYISTRPMKGQLGGAIARLDPQDLSVKVFRNVIPNQSITSIAPVSETNELLCTSTIQGGTSAIPTEKEACAFLWDVDRKEVVLRLKLRPGATRYGNAVSAGGGIVYFCCENTCYALDARNRKIIFEQEFPVRMRWLSNRRAGPKGWIYGVGGDAIFGLDPADHHIRILARHPSLTKESRSDTILVSRDLKLYYGIGSHLWRCSLAGAE